MQYVTCDIASSTIPRQHNLVALEELAIIFSATWGSTSHVTTRLPSMMLWMTAVGEGRSNSSARECQSSSTYKSVTADTFRSSFSFSFSL